jgi:SAM-dependent methyltransferase
MSRDRSTTYVGTDNLEAMEGAHNYNEFLIAAISGHAAQGASLLDFGAGTGTHARALRDAGFDVSCVEPDVRLRASLAKEGFRVVGDVTQVETGTFDTAYGLNVLEHIADDDRAVRDLSATLRPHGSLILYVPAFEVLFSEMDRKVGHFRRYRKKELTDLVNRAGLHVHSCDYVDSFGFLAALVYRLVGRSGDLSRRSIEIYDRALFPLSRVMDHVTRRWLGKNLLLVAVRD